MKPEAHPLCHAGSIAWVPPPQGAPAGVRTGVSTRRGGVSRGPYASLNLGTRTADEPDHPAANLSLLTEATGVAFDRAARIRLVHGTRIVAAAIPGTIGEADGLWTDRPGLPLALTVADCLPLALAAPTGAVALVHCGWRGLAAGIGREAVAVLSAGAGVAPELLWAWIGPGIGPCCFTVGADVAARFPIEVRRGGSAGEPWRIGLADHLRRELLAAGMRPAAIQDSGLCTSCAAGLFYSHRRDRGVTGRLIAWIERPEPVL